MLRSSMVCGILVLGLAVLVGAGASQEKKEKAALPAGFKALNLTASQDDKVRQVSADYKVKIDEMSKKLKELQAEKIRAELAVLTEEQRQLFIKNKTGEDAKKKEAAAKKKEEKKTDK
jgi:hypothetical protein